MVRMSLQYLLQVSYLDIHLRLYILFLLWPIVGLRFALDPSTAPPGLHLSSSSLTVSYHEESIPTPPSENNIRMSAMSSNPRACCHVRADVVITRGQYYWEVDVCNSSSYMTGKSSPEFVSLGSVPECLLFPEILTISQQDHACLNHTSEYDTQTCKHTRTREHTIRELHSS